LIAGHRVFGAQDTQALTTPPFQAPVRHRLSLV
jgi:hypothetical protein